MTDASGSLFEAALRYAELGYPVFPCAPARKEPLTPNGHLDATTDPTQIEQWWSARPNANVAIATAGLLVVDVDPGATWLFDEPERQAELGCGALSLTPRGGRHYVFRQPGDRHWRNTAGALAERVDTRADGGYIVAPPSVLTGGKGYHWAPGLELDGPPEALTEPPAWLTEQLDELATGGDTAARAADDTPDANTIPDGQRNSALANLAGTMRRVGMTQAEILAALHRVNADRCRPPLAEREVARVASSVSRYAPDEVAVAVAENHWDQMMAGERPPEFDFQAVTSRELATNDYSLEYLIDGILVRGQPMLIGGPKKSLKTNTSIDLALSLGHGGLFLNRFNVREAVRVGVMSAESGAATIQETAKRIAWSKNWSLANFENVVWAFDVPQLNVPAHMAALRRFLVHNELEVIILDPTYLMMLGIGSDAGNLFVVGQFLKAIGDLVSETGCTPILCHHLKKSIAEPFEPAELENIAWAGFQEFVRQWLLLNRRVKYDPDIGGHHEMWMSVGGSAGHSGLWGVDVDEGTPQEDKGRRWDVELLSASEAYAQRADDEQRVKERRQEQHREQRHRKHCDALWRALQKHPDGESMTSLRRESKLNPDNFQTAIEDLVDDGFAEACTFTKGKRTLEGYRPLSLPDQADQTRPNGLFG